MDWPIFWNALQAIGSVVAVILAMIALLYSIKTFNKSVRLSTYEILDTMYWELLKAGLEKPFLRNESLIRNDEQKREYEIYAHMAWCVLETIYDRAVTDNDNQLFDTWRSAMEIENRLHREWFDKPENEYKFKETFRVWVSKNLSSPERESKNR